jgi:enterobacteria phage integrase
MTEIDQLADALFDRFRNFMASGTVQPLVSRDGLPVGPRGGEQLRTLNDWIDIYDGLLDQRGYCHQTLRNRRANLRHVRSLWGANPLQATKPRHISDALQRFLPERAAMARRIYDELRDVYREAVANEWCETNPVLNTRRPQCKVKRKRLSLDTWDDMCEAALVHRQAWVLPMLLLALTTGQRRADLAKMRFSDVWDGHLHIEQQKKAGKEYGARVALPLTLRLDEIGLTLADVIEICRRYGPGGQTLLRRNDGKPIELSSLSTRFNEVIRGCCGKSAYGDREWPSLHEVRSLAERLYRKQGIATQHLLGHKSQDMTDKYNDDRGLTAGEYKRLVA